MAVHSRRAKLTEKIWLHANAPTDPDGLADLLEILKQNRPALEVVATGEAVPDARRANLGPFGNRFAYKAFFEQHRPAAILFCGRLDPALAALPRRHDIPAIWADADTSRQRRWPLLGQAKTEVVPQTMRAIVTAPGPEFDRLVRDPAFSGRIEAPGMLRAVPRPLPHDPHERDRLSAHFGARPLWLAATPAPGEWSALFEAHRLATRLSHRLLMIVSTTEGNGPEFCRAAAAEGWAVALYSAEELPEVDVQILVAEGPAKLGLWYRLAPMTFLGGTLCGARSRTPFEPATHGSAVLHGSRVAIHAERIQALARAGAARRVDGGEALGRAVSQLLAPETTARMATAAWEVVTAGAPALNRVAALVEDVLDGVLPP